MKRLALVFAILAAPPALAQGAPSFDCAKASNAVDRAICKDAALSKADREMAAAYAALLGRLTGVERDELVRDQVRWIVSRNGSCQADADTMMTCLKERYESRSKNLRVIAEGGIPLISEHSLVRQGKLGRIAWSYAIAWPRFESATVDFAALNARFADAARKSADDATPTADAGLDREQQWNYEQSFTLDRPPGSRAVSVAVSFYGYSGGAHGYGATRCTLVDLRTGRAVGPQGVFTTGEQWLRVMSQIVGADLRKQFVERPGFEEALEPSSLAKTLSEADHYCWAADRLELVFNAYEVGPYAAGPYQVDIPYDRLKPILRTDGPIPR